MSKTKRSSQVFAPVVAILDAGAQYVDMIKKAAERHGFPAEIFGVNTKLDQLPVSIKAIIVSGGPSSSNETGAPMPDADIWEQESKPTLNVCYGMQALVKHAGGDVGRRVYREDGIHETDVDNSHALFKGVRSQTKALFTHGDFINSVPDSVKIIGSHDAAGERVVSAVQYKDRHVAVQFHPEVFDDTPQGYEMYGNFFSEFCGLAPNEEFIASQMQRYIDEKHNSIKSRVKDKHVIAFVSGGVDSSVATALVRQVVDRDKLHMYYIDSGFMRVQDDKVIDQLKSAGFAVNIIDARQRFEQAKSVFEGENIGPLIESTNPRHKRRLIGETFVDIQDDIVAELGLKQDDVVLLQGTNAADRIESGHSSSGGGQTAQIKEHHNQVQRVRDLNPLEPLEDLFKDEIRTLAVSLGLPDELAYRQPFPGPGLAIRILGGGDFSDVDDLRKVKAALDKEQTRIENDFDCRLGTRLLEVRSVGVGGDARSYAHPIALDYNGDSRQLASISKQITGRFQGIINRVIVKIAGDDIELITPTPTTLDRNNREVLRAADAIAHEQMKDLNLLRDIEQMPVILLPCGVNGKRSIVLRPVRTKTHMTSTAMLPSVHLDDKLFTTIADHILKNLNEQISHVFFDATNKPPGTTEWE